MYAAFATLSEHVEPQRKIGLDTERQLDLTCHLVLCANRVAMKGQMFCDNWMLTLFVVVILIDGILATVSRLLVIFGYSDGGALSNFVFVTFIIYLAALMTAGCLVMGRASLH